MEENLALTKEEENSFNNFKLSKLVFDQDCVNLVRSNSIGKIVCLKLDPVVYPQNFDSGYNSMAYLLSGKFKDFDGSINGVIRPYKSASDFNNLPPEFHFFIKKPECFEIGKSILYPYEDRLMCKLMKWDKEEKVDINFKVRLSIESRLVYFKR